jgi:hypothetical protein
MFDAAMMVELDVVGYVMLMVAFVEIAIIGCIASVYNEL